MDHKQSPFAPRVLVVVLAILGLMIAALTNVATNVIPEWLKPYLWLSLPILGVLVLAFLWLTWRSIKEEREKEAISPEYAQRNRRAMLELVKNTWVKGVLERSPYHELHELIQLGMEHRPEREHPRNMDAYTSHRPNRTLPPGTHIIDVFHQSSSPLLILGEPGAGKTTTLLKLARDKIARAEKNPNLFIPVVFNLSSWSDPNQSMADWLVAEFAKKYFIPKNIATGWVEQNKLLLLLDGLDEVDASRRDKCVQAINDFIQYNHWLVSMAICCRTGDYETLETKLLLSSAVLLQPLTNQQVDGYLEQAGASFSALRNRLQSDPTLQELAQLPLMLSILMLAYQDAPEEAFTAYASNWILIRRKQIFDAYIEKMFKRVEHIDNELYSKEQTLRWLAWLARKLSERNQTLFLLEQINPSWLDTRKQERLAAIAIPVLVGLVGLVAGLPGGLVGGLAGGLFAGLFYWDSMGRSTRPSQVVNSKWSWHGARSTAIIGLVAGLVLGLIGGLAFGLASGLVRGLVIGLIAGLFYGLVGGLFFGLDYGGALVIRHYTLRLVLSRKGYMPLNYVRFLDYAADRIFLRKVGGGYIFVHRLLQEHFAAMDIAPSGKK